MKHEFDLRKLRGMILRTSAQCNVIQHNLTRVERPKACTI